MAEHNVLGREGENAAIRYLESKGHKIIERNWMFKGYEIDIITLDSEYIVFVEVKTRSSLEWGFPEDAIGIKRMRRMIRAASHYLKINQIDNPTRFDVVTVVLNNKEFELNHIEDAFLPFLD